MLKIFLLFLPLFTGIVLGPLLSDHQSYVLIQTNNYNIETNVIGLAIILIITEIMLFIIIYSIRYLLHIRVHAYVWFVERKRRLARKQTEQALLKLIEGDFQQVEKLMSQNADYAEQPVVNYLLAAEAAQKDNDEVRANQHLERAMKLTTNNLLPVEITRIRLQLARNENRAANHSINQLLKVTPRHPGVLRLAEQVYIRTGAWDSLLNIIPSMAKAKIGNNAHYNALQRQAWIGLMDQIQADLNGDGQKTSEKS